jgi:hypothetical protein
MSSPMLRPSLMPESTSVGLGESANSQAKAAIAQSAGVPEQA